ncbi:MAG: hypothetical protein JNM55_10505 [Anaerolineales bacterium]|nr:hypothetical protein [Anaerolineales bacterium]
MNYFSIFKEALKIFWRHKSLWILGIIITIFGQGEYGFSVNYRESYPAGQSGLPDMPGRDLLINFFNNPIPYIIGFSLLSLFLWIIQSLICWWSQSTLISMVNDIDQQGSTSIRNGLNAGKQKAIPLTILSVLFALPTAIINLPAIAGGIWFFSKFFDAYKDLLLGETPSPEAMQTLFEPIMSNILLGFACIFPLVFIGGILGWLLGLLNKVTARVFVLENLSISESIRQGWKIARGNFGHILLNGIVLIVISVIFGWVAAIPALAIWVPVARALIHQNWSITSVILAVIMALYFLIIAVGLGGILTSFNSVLWTKLYKAMTIKDVVISDNHAS